MPHIPDESIHPELRRVGRAVRRFPSFTPRALRTAACVMNAADRMGVWPGKSPRPRRAHLARPDGTRLVVSVFDPKGGTAPGAPVVVWIHGGGFALGAPLQDFYFIDQFVGMGCTVVAPSYRLSTRVPYPAAFDDCYRTLLWAYETFCEGAECARPLAVGGDSAGGSLCAAVCLRARDEGSVRVSFHMPLYPMLDDRMTTPSSRENDAPCGTRRLTRRRGACIWGSSTARTMCLPTPRPPVRSIFPECRRDAHTWGISSRFTMKRSPTLSACARRA